MKNIELASTAAWRREYVDDPPVFLMTFQAAAFNNGAPFRIAPGHEAQNFGGAIYESFALELALPDDGSQRAPRCQVRLGNVSRTLMPALLDNALDDATVTLQIARRGADGALQDAGWQTTLRVDDVAATNDELTVSLSHAVIMDQRCIRGRFAREFAPGLFG